LQQIGEGGMGSVWMADQTEPVKRRVAVKLIRVERGNSKTILSRFEAERQAIALMDHPNIAKLLDAGTTDAGQPFFVMELVKGIPLTEYCDAHKLSIQARLNLFMQICSAVQHAHQKGIIHRDLKPTNILVESHDGKPVPKIIDFGLAKATSGMQLTENTLFTAFGNVMGTPLYMAPEQANFNAVDVDTRADVYALGVILYELLTGTTPIARDSVKKAALDVILKLVREQEAPTPSSRLSSSEAKPTVAANRQTEPATLGRFVKGELDWIVMKSLSKERDRRYETANGFARDIERFLQHEPVQAGPPSTTYKLRKFVQRNRPQVIAASLVLLTLLGGIAGTTIGLILANESAAAAQLAKEDADTKRSEAEQARVSEAKRAESERLAKLDALAKTAEAERATVRAEAGEKLAGERLVLVDAEKKKAVEEKQIAQAVQDFLQHKLLGQADVRFQANALLRAGGLAAEAKQNPTIRELLDRAALELTEAKIDANFPHQPLVQMEILHTVGKTYIGVGESERAIGLLQRAYDLAKQHLGPDDANTLSNMNNLAVAYHQTGKWHLALPLHEQTLKRMQATLGIDHRETLINMNNLAAAYLDAGELNLALPLFEETFKLKTAKFGLDHPDTLLTMNSLAGAYGEVGKGNLAVPLFEKTLKLLQKKLGVDHPQTLITMNSLGVAYLDAEMLNLAVPLLEEALEKSKVKVGADHPDTLNCRHNLAKAYMDTGKLHLAVPLYQETLKLQKEKLGSDHPQTLMTMNALAQAYKQSGQLALALPLFEETLKRSKTAWGPDHPRTLSTMEGLAGVYHDGKRPDLALPLLEETLKLKKAKLGHDHPRTLICMTNLATAYKGAGKLDQALPLFKETIKRMIKKHGPDHRDTLATMNGLAAAYWSAKLLDQSIPLFEETLRRQEAKLGRQHSDTQLTVANLGVNYKDAGRLAEALPLLEEAYRAVKKYPSLSWVNMPLLDAYFLAGKSAQVTALANEFLADFRNRFPGTPQLADKLSSIASAMLQMKAYTQAEPLLRESLDIYTKKLPNHWLAFDTRSLLGGALLGQKKYTDAEPLLLAGYEGMKQREKTIPAQSKIVLRESIERLVQLYDALDKKDDAAKWRQALEQQQGKRIGGVQQVGNGLQMRGNLDAKNATLIYQVALEAGKTYVIDMISPNQKALDPYLVLLDAAGRKLAEDDDGGGELNARIVFHAEKAGTYRIQATSFNAGTGTFTLTIQEKRSPAAEKK
jgi:serine/threonine protein kinase